MKRLTLMASAVCALALAASAVPASAHTSGGGGTVKTVLGGLKAPRGVASVRSDRTLVSEGDGTVVEVREHRHGPATVRRLVRVPALGAPAIASGRHGRIYILTGAATSPDSSDPAPPANVAAAEKKLFVWKSGWKKPQLMADIGAFQKKDPDPYDLEKNPSDSNPFGVAALHNGDVLVADAAGNDLLKVRKDGRIYRVALLKPRVVRVPKGALPPGSPSRIRAEAVATSVTVGSDGYYYVGELRGFPGTPRTSEIWRIRPGSHHAVCDPKLPDRPRCKRYADGLTSIVDLASGKHGAIYAVTLSKKSWLAIESQPPAPGATIGGLFKVSRWGHHVTELATNKLVLPGGADTAKNGTLYVTGPQLPVSPGKLLSLDG